jgi:HK97 family phage portal protein
LGFLRDLGAGFKALTATPAVLEALDRRQLQPYLSLGSSPNARKATDRINSIYVATQAASYGWIYASSPAVREVIDYIARNVAQLGLKVYKRISDDEREHVGDHPAAQALRWPNGWTPGQQLVFEFVADFLIYDNAYLLKFPADNGLTLVNIPAHMVGIVGRSFYQPEGYRIWNQDGESFDIPTNRIVHWRGKNPLDPRRGESKLETLREELASDAAARQATTELYRSGLMQAGVIERPIEAPEWNDEGMERFIKSWSARAKKSTSETAVLEEGMTYRQLGVTPEDAEMIAARRYTTEKVAGQYGMRNVPPQTEEERYQFYTDALAPLTVFLACLLELWFVIELL